MFFPNLEKNNIDTVVHLGDLVDRRKHININTANRLRNDFLNPLNDMNINTHFIAGNHDTYYKNTNEINSIREFVEGKYQKFIIYDRYSTEVNFDGIPILFIPWICDDNRDQVLEQCRNTKAQIAMGHLEIQGFEMYKGSIVSHGDDRNNFAKFDMVMSGHYHHRSSDGHIFYLGAHAEFTWSDYDDPRGFHIFDTQNRELTFVQNPYKLFKKIWYNDSEKQEINVEEYKESIVRVIVQEKNNPYLFDKFIEELEEVNPVDIQIVEDHLNLAMDDDQDLINEAESTLDIFKKYINSSEFKGVKKENLENKIVELYNEALELE
ncbi:endonuclease subunit [uncultured Caudovirales phage]|uniref:Endonuclease subunit n=1 Tax=uncultured Caudovirales phage TaxID=2100421 RepID=A0A6J5P5T7_9CAUD|nr:endonuclease subunit [uncultured Caudovirales phage]